MSEELTTGSLIHSGEILRQRVEEYLAIRKVVCQPSSMEVYRTQLERFISFVREHGGVVNVATYAAFIEYMLKQRASATAHKARRVLSAFFRWCVRAGYMQNSPDLLVPRFKIKPVHTHHFITADEYHRMREVVKDTPYEWALVCAYNTGMSQCDVCLLKWEDVDLNNMVLVVARKKTGVASLLAFEPGDELYDWLTQIKTFVRGQPPWDVYVSPTLAFKFTRCRAGVAQRLLRAVHAVVKNCTFHDFRHTYCSKGMNSGLSSIMVGKMVGHTQVQTLSGYVIPDLDTMRTARRKLLAWEPAQMQQQTTTPP